MALSPETILSGGPSGGGTHVRRLHRRHAVYALLGAFLFASGVFALVARYSVQSVGTAVMTPAINYGSSVLVDHGEAGGHGVRRGDVVLIANTWGGPFNGMPFVERVIAVAGDRVQCCSPSGRLIINGQPSKEAYAHGNNAAFGQFEVIVPPGRVFVLGDARSISLDSRAHLDSYGGTLPVDGIRGRIVATWSSLVSFHVVSGGGGAFRFPLYAFALVLVLIAMALWVAAVWPLARRGATRLTGRLRARG